MGLSDACRIGAIIGVIGVYLAGCSSETTSSSDPMTQTHSSVESIPGNSVVEATSSRSVEATTSVTEVAPSKELTPLDVVCDLISNPNTGRTSPVAVLEGAVHCDEAMSVARDYLAGIAAGRQQGQGAFLTIRGWDCSWPYVDGRSHADSYLKCVDPTGLNAIRIGN